MSIQVMAGVIPQFELHDRLRKAREHAGLEQADLAERMGVSRGTVSNAERGLRAVRKITVNAWALATGVSAKWLETGEAPTSPSGPLGKLPGLDSNQEPFD